MAMDVAAARERFETEGLSIADVSPHPIDQFDAWFSAAEEVGYFEPEAMILSTVDADGVVDARTVLCRGTGPDGFRFFTNYLSAKSIALDHSDSVALLFTWVELRRQIRVVGNAARLDDDANDAYFASRPRGSQIGAWASPQSEVIADRKALDNAYRELEERFAGGSVPRPPHWGGYLVRPRAIEFWQGRPNRLHDRVRYRLVDDSWIIERLAP